MNTHLPDADSKTTLQGRLEKITYYNPEDHFVIARFQPAGSGGLITILGHMPEPAIGGSLSISGTWRKHPRYGQQFVMDSYRIVLPSDVDGVRKYLESGLIKGLGPATVERLIRHFKEETLDVIENRPALLESVRGIGPATARRIALSWKVHHGLKHLMDFLRDNGLKAAYGARLYRLYGSRALAILKDDPWQLVDDLPRIGFTIADALMQKKGVSANDLERVKGCVLHLLYLYADEGNVCVREAEFTRRSRRQFQIEAPVVLNAIEQLLAEEKIVAESEPTVAADRYIYLMPLHAAEKVVAGKMAALIAHRVKPPPIDSGHIHQTVLQHLALKLSSEQATVLKDILAHRAALITGGPGTGKTTLIRSITAIFSSMRQKVFLCAPTGRAARRLAELTGKQAATVHRMLGFNPDEGVFQHNRDNPLPADVIIVDEASMVDTILMQHLLHAVHLDTRLILVGDVFQLPSVGPGNVLADLIASGQIKTYELKKIFRQAQQSSIIINAHRIRDGKPPVLPQPDQHPDGSDFYFVHCHKAERVVQQVIEICGRGIPERFGFDPIQDIQVLVPMRKGVVGTYNLNQRLQESLNPGPAMLYNQGRHFRTGDKVMHLHNNYSKDVFNGDSGVICDIDIRNGIVSVDYDSRIVDYETGELDELDLAYAITIHKSQGSEYPAVIVPLTTQHYALLQRNLVYTAATRAKQLVVVVGSEKALSIALENDRHHQRLSRLAGRLRDDLSALP